MGKLLIWCLIGWGMLWMAKRLKLEVAQERLGKLCPPYIPVVLAVPMICYALELAVGWYSALSRNGLDKVIEGQLVR